MNGDKGYNLKVLTQSLCFSILSLIKKYSLEKRTNSNKFSLIPFSLCESDNYNFTPNVVRYYVTLIPVAIQKIENSKEYREFCVVYLNDKLFNNIFPIQERIPICDITFPIGYLISLIWRYINQCMTIDWDIDKFNKIYDESHEILSNGFIKIKLIIPLVGISGRFSVPEIKIDSKWYIRTLKDNELFLLDKVKHYFRLPVTMSYSGKSPPILKYILTCDDYKLNLRDLAAGWNIIKQENLPIKEIKYMVSVLQASATISEEDFGENYSINSPVIIYKSDQWAANPFNNPFSLFYSWPLNNCPYNKGWITPTINWSKWVKQNFDFINNSPKEERERYKRALKWFSKSLDTFEVDERMVSLFIALETLCLGGNSSRGKGQKLGLICSKALNKDINEQRKWRNFIEKLYNQIRNNLMHDGIDIDKLSTILKNEFDFQDVDSCANMIEIIFRGTWNYFVVNNGAIQ